MLSIHGIRFINPLKYHFLLFLAFFFLLACGQESTNSITNQSTSVENPAKPFSDTFQDPALTPSCPRTETATYSGPAGYAPPSGGIQPGGTLKCFAYAAVKAYEIVGNYPNSDASCMGSDDIMASSNWFEEITFSDNTDFFNKICRGDVVQHNQGQHYSVVTLVAGNSFQSIMITDANRFRNGIIRTYQQPEYDDRRDKMNGTSMNSGCAQEIFSVNENLQAVIDEQGAPTKIYRTKNITINTTPPAAPFIYKLYDPTHPKFYWNPVNTATEYEIYKKEDSYPGDPNGAYVLLTTTTNTFFIDTSEEKWSGFGPKSKVWYKVKAGSGNVYSGFSNYLGETVGLSF